MCWYSAPTLCYFIQHRIIYNKMVGYLSIFIPDPFWSLGFGDRKRHGDIDEISLLLQLNIQLNIDLLKTKR